MEEKKSTNISLSTALLIISILIIIFMAYYIYVEKTKANNEISKLEINATEMEKTISNLQEKIDTISNTINNTSVEVNNSQSNDISTNKEVKFSDEEIKESLQNYLELVGAREASPFALLVKLGLCNNSDATNATTADNYVKTNIKYSAYKEKMLNYVTEEWLNTKFNNSYKEQDGMLYYLDVGATGMKFEVKDITIKGDYSELAYIAQVYDVALDGSKELDNVEFHIANNNGKCVISYCD